MKKSDADNWHTLRSYGLVECEGNDPQWRGRESDLAHATLWRYSRCLVEYSTGYIADHWCDKGHILFCLKVS